VCYVVKVETIGDAYTCVSGVPVRDPNHAEELANMALAIRYTVSEFKVFTSRADYIWSYSYSIRCRRLV